MTKLHPSQKGPNSPASPAIERAAKRYVSLKRRGKAPYGIQKELCAEFGVRPQSLNNAIKRLSKA